MAALSRFISRSADKTTPFFKVLKGNKEFKWEVEQQEAFQALKEHLKKLPTLARPKLGETLYLYIAVTTATISAVIIREEAKQQQPIYFVSYTLCQAERNYSLIEKAAYAVVVAARKLRPYFDAHPVVVLTDQPLEKAMDKFEKSGRLLRWAIELSEYGIKYQPRTAIKAQALADFLAECSYRETVTPTPGVWEVYTDGSATVHGSGAGVVLISPDKTEHEHALRFSFPASNNEAEYEAVIAGMELARLAGAEHVVLMTDSQLVSNQIRGEYETREISMIRYMEAVKEEASKLKSFDIKLIPRGKNGKADALSKLASSSLDNCRRTVTVDVREGKSIGEDRSVCLVEDDSNWMTPMIEYLNNGSLPTDPIMSKKIKRTAGMFRIINDELYRMSFSSPLLKCISGEDANLVLREIHEGICGHHVGGRNLAHKALRAGYYWPTMLGDAKRMTQKCKKCQVHAPLIHAPARDLQSVLSPIPFAQWGMDIIGPFAVASGGRKFLIVAVDYFSKWIEAEAVAKITEPAVRRVIWANIITRFGVPKVIVFDHGRQFWNNPIKAWLTKFDVKFAYSSVCHPQSNGQAESANKQVLAGLRNQDNREGCNKLHPLPPRLRL